ncbi:ferredoxin reductase, partial [Nocardia farcinica]|uniref:ferredoxin reductase n=1 Tax=Nocardia farcinica TaxID=37329 RepID=UPI0024571B19
MPADLELVVAAARMLCADIRELELRDPAGAPLPAFPPGGHIAVAWGRGLRNSYSLTGPGEAPSRYTISVRLDPAGRGGSRWLHRLPVGARLRVSPPRGDFAPVARAHHHLLLAGGIGVTPILSHVRAALRWDRSFRVVYVHRPESAPHAAELAGMCGDRLTGVTSRERFWDTVGPLLRDSPLGTHLYVCGPEPMIEAVRRAAAAAGGPGGRVDTAAMTATRAESPFASGTVVRRGDVELAVFQCGDPAAPPLLLIHGWPD